MKEPNPPQLIYILDKVICNITPCGERNPVTASIQSSGKEWIIKEWYNRTERCRNKGYGKTCLRVLAQTLLEKDAPEKITYIWNGMNDYVGNLVQNVWGGVCRAPISVLKYEAADTKEGHMYDLKTDRFLDWLQLVMPSEYRYTHLESEIKCEITDLLDENSAMVTPGSRFSHYLLADQLSLEQKVLPIRVPGRTMGGVWVDDRMRIVRILMNTEDPYTEDIMVKLNALAGKTLEMPEQRKETDA